MDAQTGRWRKAIETGDLRTVKALLPECAGRVDDDGETGLHKAVRAKNLALARLLAKEEAGIVSEDGNSALLLAAQGNSPELCSLLLPAEAEILLPDSSTAHLVAAKAGSADALAVLNPHFSLLRDANDLTALDYAAANGHLWCVKSLVEFYKPQGNDVGHAAMLARENGHLEIADYLETGKLPPKEPRKPRMKPPRSKSEKTRGSMDSTRSLDRIPTPTLAPSSFATEPSRASIVSLQERSESVSVARLQDAPIPCEDDDAELIESTLLSSRPIPFQPLSPLTQTQPMDLHEASFGLLYAEFQRTQTEVEHLQVLLKEKDMTIRELQSHALGGDALGKAAKRGGLCGGRSKSQRLSQSELGFLPLLEQKDQEIGMLRTQLQSQTSQIEGYIAQYTTLSQGTSMGASQRNAVAYGDLLATKDAVIERLVTLCEETKRWAKDTVRSVPNSLTTPRPASFETGIQTESFAAPLALPPIPVAAPNIPTNIPIDDLQAVSAIDSAISKADLAGNDYEFLMLRKDFELERLRNLCTDVATQRFAALARLSLPQPSPPPQVVYVDNTTNAEDLQAALKDRMLRELGIVKSIQLVYKKTASLLDLVEEQRGTLQEVAATGNSPERRYGRDMCLDDLERSSFDEEQLIHNINENLDSIRMRLKGAFDFTRELAATVHRLNQGADALTQAIDVGEVPSQKIDYSSLLWQREKEIQRLQILAIREGIPARHSTSADAAAEAKDEIERLWRRIRQQESVINELRHHLENSLRPTGSATEDLMSTMGSNSLIQQLGDRNLTSEQLEAVERLKLEHSAMKLEIRTLREQLADSTRAISFFAERYTRNTRSDSSGGAKGSQRALELQIEALQTELMTLKQNLGQAKNELTEARRVAPDTREAFAATLEPPEADRDDPFARTFNLAGSGVMSPSGHKGSNTSMEIGNKQFLRSTLQPTERRYQSTLRPVPKRMRGEFTELMQAVVDRDVCGVGSHLDLMGATAQNGVTALMLAAAGGFRVAAEYLLEGEAGMADDAGRTALVYALERSQFTVAELLTPYEAPDVSNVDARDRRDRTTELMEAVQKDDLARAWVLLPLQHGLRDEAGRTALLHAIEKLNVPMIRMLLPLEHAIPGPSGRRVSVIAEEMRGSEAALRVREAVTLFYERALGGTC
ncbi:Ankyrin repeat protein 1 [Giardia muris]|uniref:Ankyrin repeat protein 1 n=1 Tax=Giardia muris TaxID=5742 RepID=A0A4Z1SPN6_GIAMU|nr:Ankyrin repeat protein 1 [Giardia muris]|eukprot:TNJ27620.1 Ankyrin repeat protein 1 [Giardia muris]